MAFVDPFKVKTFPALADMLMEPSPDRFAVTVIVLAAPVLYVRLPAFIVRLLATFSVVLFRFRMAPDLFTVML